MRIVARLSAALVLASSLAAVAGSAQASPGERWCSTPGVAKPCIESFTYNGSAMTAGNAMDLTVTPFDTPDYGHTFTFSVQPDGSAPIPATLSEGDTIAFVLDTGAQHPDYISGFEHQTDVDVWKDSTSGDWMLKVTGSAVRTGLGCDDSAPWPWPCPPTATDDLIEFEGDVTAYNADTNQDFVGFYVGTNVTYNGIFFETDSTGHQFLETEAVSPHYYHDGATVVHGAIHFRVPYVMLRDDFGIPNPETMTAGSLTGTVNSATATFNIQQDPDGGGIFVDVSGFTFTKRTIKVMAGTIKPTKPVITKAKRVSGRRIWLTHTLSKARGAKVTGYVARCVNGSSVLTGTAAASATGIGVSGLKAAKAYDCRVAATSKVGRSAWSAAVHVRRA
ncbi:MAG TPA: fibronectin type III domain-containing protein [Nocardioides sp.]|nr:fibronectin type III domain-containing protein [Nocardioides sp.]